MNKKSLVSVVVLTYNSEKFILSTLESILFQDYDRIELVISDDGSKDGTCEIVENWISANSSHFENCFLIKSFNNKGTCQNYNQGVYNSHGEFIKTLDGDDILNGKNAISDYVNFIRDNNLEICISDVEVFSDDEADLSGYIRFYDYCFSCVKESLSNQKKRIIRELALPDPGLFFSRKLYDVVGGFNEKYKLQEEWPFFIKVLDANYHVGALENKLVKYRISYTSATHDKTKKSYVKKMCAKDNLDFYWDVIFNKLLKEKEFYYAFKQFYFYLLWYLKEII